MRTRSRLQFLALAASLGLVLAAPSQGSVTPSVEQGDLRFMREEEKLARDVYTVLGEQWKLQVFANIQRSEQQHVDAVAALLKARGLEDPSAALPAGQFADPPLQALYTRLVEGGTQDRMAALRTGAAIEEIDIRDLSERIARASSADIRSAYENLRDASWRHLASFVRNLQREGVHYTPQYLDPAEYARHIAA